MTISPIPTGTPIETLKLSSRPYNALERNGVETVEALCSRSRDELSLLRGVGETIIAEIENALANRGLSLRTAETVAQEPPAAETDTPPAPETEPSFDYPYKDVSDDDPKRTFKLIVNTLTEVLAKEPDHPKRAEIERQLKESKEMADAPEGYYPWSYVHGCNPINSLTREEKLHCIRTLPIDIVNKLFPHV
jgi:hypothetical protein